ncbi:MAG: beta-glucosidase [Acidobacteriaceae bacterium]
MNFYRHVAPLLALGMAGILFAFLHSPKEIRAAAALPAFRNQSLPIEQRIQDVINRMTLEEKIRMCFGGEQPGVVQFYGVPRLGIPSLLQSDGPRGIAGARTATSFPSGIGLTASWDYNLIYQAGVAIGQEARAVGRTMVLGPAINIDRDPLDGRFFEYGTEDPYLNARLAPAEIQGLQSQKVAACVKHFVCNNREDNRGSYMSNVGERALHEIYFPGFRAAVEQGKTWGVMTAANGVNGSFAPANKYLITTVLEKRWGFKGVVRSDGNHARSTLGAAFAGLDVGMAAGHWKTDPFGKPLMDAVLQGKVPVSIVDDKVRRVLRVMALVGILNGVPATTGGSINTPQHQELALRAAEESMVLLKNDNATLPLDKAKIKKIVVLGPNANRRLCKHGYGGSSAVESPYEVTALAGIRKELQGRAEVDYINFDDAGDFEPIGPENWQPIHGQRGLLAQYFNDGEKTPAVERVDPEINFMWEMSSPDPKLIHNDNFSAHYQGKLIPKVTGFYTLRLSGEDTSILRVDKNPVIMNTETGRLQTGAATVHLEAGHVYSIDVAYHAGQGDASLHLDWSLPHTPQQSAAAIHAIEPQLRNADAVIFVGGWGHALDTEGMDRTNMNFPQGQARAIREIAAINPRTIVVLMHGSPFTVDGWIHSVPAVLDAFYPGMEGGTAIAEALFGDVNPSGKLTFTWPRRLSDSPAHSVGTEDRDNVNYNEGIFVGYRYFDEHKIQPAFPFGFGLSYSTFHYSNLHVEKLDNGTGDIDVTADITNTSARPGVEIAQMYIAPPKISVPMPVRELKGFARIGLAAHETKKVNMVLHHRDFAYWDVKSHSLVVAPGVYGIDLGSSSRDLLLTSSVHVTK